jgi:hypothetical protein
VAHAGVGCRGGAEELALLRSRLCRLRAKWEGGQHVARLALVGIGGVLGVVCWWGHVRQFRGVGGGAPALGRWRVRGRGIDNQHEVEGGGGGRQLSWGWGVGVIFSLN